jgi:ubiquinone/menaquinone biosynthesis C-methylase UbiE
VKKFIRWAGYAAAYSTTAYLIDVPIRRAAAARAARAYADTRGLPLLNVGAGTGRTALFGSTLYGDINTDLAGRKDVPHGTPGVVTYADAQDLHDFEGGSIGAVLASHVLEHLPDPDKALAEWRRVVGGDNAALFIVTPLWWAPHTWFHNGHIWYFGDGHGGQVTPGRVRLRRLRA